VSTAGIAGYKSEVSIRPPARSDTFPRIQCLARIPETTLLDASNFMKGFDF
jgi:hypothetical protein